MPDYRCDQCERTAADFIVGVILTGDQTYLCAPCLPKFANTVKRAMADAAKAEQNAGIAPEPPADGDEAEWEAGYPEGRPDGVEGPSETPPEVSGSDTKTAPTSVE